MSFFGGFLLALFVGMNLFVFGAIKHNRVRVNGRAIHGFGAYLYGLFFALFGCSLVVAIIGATISFVLAITLPIWVWFV